jgi:hypothetical protein
LTVEEKHDIQPHACHSQILIADFRFQVASQQSASQPPTELRFQISNFRLPVNSQPTSQPTTELRFQISDFRLPANSQPASQPTTELRFQISEFRIHILDLRLSFGGWVGGLLWIGNL